MFNLELKNTRIYWAYHGIYKSIQAEEYWLRRQFHLSDDT